MGRWAVIILGGIFAVALAGCSDFFYPNWIGGGWDGDGYLEYDFDDEPCEMEFDVFIELDDCKGTIEGEAEIDYEWDSGIGYMEWRAECEIEGSRFKNQVDLKFICEDQDDYWGGEYLLYLDGSVYSNDIEGDIDNQWFDADGEFDLDR